MRARDARSDFMQMMPVSASAREKIAAGSVAFCPKCVSIDLSLAAPGVSYQPRALWISHWQTNSIGTWHSGRRTFLHMATAAGGAARGT